MQQYTLISPLYVDLPRKTKKDKRIYLNINTYRNLHFILNNEAKKIYKELMRKQIEELPKLGKINLVFTLYKNSNRKLDRHNVCCIIQKFFCDSLVELEKLEDDNDDFITYELYKTGGVVKSRGYCEIVITEI